MVLMVTGGNELTHRVLHQCRMRQIGIKIGQNFKIILRLWTDEKSGTWLAKALTPLNTWYKDCVVAED